MKLEHADKQTDKFRWGLELGGKCTSGRNIVVEAASILLQVARVFWCRGRSPPVPARSGSGALKWALVISRIGVPLGMGKQNLDHGCV
jgi:hypothetical protein